MCIRDRYQAENTERLERMIRSHIAPPPAPEPCAEPMRRILMKAMAPEVGQRYGSAREMAEDLEAFRTGGAVRAEAEDLDATRRTFRREGDETRRTSPVADKDATQRSLPRVPVKPATWPFRKPGFARWTWSNGMRLVAVLAAACLLMGLWDAASSYRLYRAGKALERDMQAERLTDPDQIWIKWTELSGSNSASVLLSGPRGVVKQRLLTAANHVITLFRNGQAQPIQDWEHARVMLADVLSLDPDERVRGELRLTEGQIACISGIYPVSYTHLDVYKRQGRRYWRRDPRIRKRKPGGQHHRGLRGRRCLDLRHVRTVDLAQSHPAQ